MPWVIIGERGFNPHETSIILQYTVLRVSNVFYRNLGEQLGDNVNRFFDALGVSLDEVAETSEIEDIESDEAANRAVKLYKISDASGSLQASEVSGMPLEQDMLNPQVIRP